MNQERNKQEDQGTQPAAQSQEPALNQNQSEKEQTALEQDAAMEQQRKEAMTERD